MIIGGLQKFSLLDFPGHLSAIVFTQGCNFRCHFCYNPSLVLLQSGKSKYPALPREKFRGNAGTNNLIPEDDFFVFLGSRAGKIEAVVVTGGEPTIHADLPRFLKKIKALGLKVKLDTNGIDPAMLGRLIKGKLVDYLAMDIKNSPARYGETAGVKIDLAKIRKSVKIIMTSGLPYEFRTTVVPGLHEMKDIEGAAPLVRGADVWYLQQFKSGTALVDKTFENKKSFTRKELEAMRDLALKYVKKCEVR